MATMFGLKMRERQLRHHKLPLCCSSSPRCRPHRNLETTQQPSRREWINKARHIPGTQHARPGSAVGELQGRMPLWARPFRALTGPSQRAATSLFRAPPRCSDPEEGQARLPLPEDSGTTRCGEAGGDRGGAGLWRPCLSLLLRASALHLFKFYAFFCVYVCGVCGHPPHIHGREVREGREDHHMPCVWPPRPPPLGGLA